MEFLLPYKDYLALWMAESTLEIFLAINRCVEVSSQTITHWLFDDQRTWLWIAPSIGYGLFVFTFVCPSLFSGLYFAWFFNPHVGYTFKGRPSSDFDSVILRSFGFSNFIQLLNTSTLLIFEQFKYYMSDLVSIHDHFVLLLLGGIYSVFGVIIMYQSGVVKKLNIFHQNAQLSISHGSHVSGRNFMVKLHFITSNYFLILYTHDRYFLK